MGNITVIIGKMWEGPPHVKDPVIAWRKRNPIKYMAQKIAWRHRKTLLKDKCEICGTDQRLETHHPDYSKPLYVQTLCKTCHELIQ